VLVLTGVFALGAVTGGGVVLYEAQHRIQGLMDKSPSEARREAILQLMRRKVGLDETQMEAVRRILIAHDPELREIRRSMAPQLGVVHKQVFAEVRRVLREDQLPQLDRLAARMDRWTRPDDAPFHSASPTVPQ
jgi:hypothetical protein